MKKETLKENSDTAEIKALEKLDMIDKMLFQLLNNWDGLTSEAVKEAFLKIAKLTGQMRTELMAERNEAKQQPSDLSNPTDGYVR